MSAPPFIPASPSRNSCPAISSRGTNRPGGSSWREEARPSFWTGKSGGRSGPSGSTWTKSSHAGKRLPSRPFPCSCTARAFAHPRATPSSTGWRRNRGGMRPTCRTTCGTPSARPLRSSETRPSTISAPAGRPPSSAKGISTPLSSRWNASGISTGSSSSSTWNPARNWDTRP
ncbi:hypothetical protein SDC9_191762 [bioreactor metagenome]|uniref:Uncharacterized protein n=1 Tax=bioreactor metagenome TaxID=1076179 RepID=A0A645HYS6_9ZZZZ